MENKYFFHKMLRPFMETQLFLGFFKCFLLNSVTEFFKRKKGAWHGFHVRAHKVKVEGFEIPVKKQIGEPLNIF